MVRLATLTLDPQVRAPDTLSHLRNRLDRRHHPHPTARSAGFRLYGGTTDIPAMRVGIHLSERVQALQNRLIVGRVSLSCPDCYLLACGTVVSIRKGSTWETRLQLSLLSSESLGIIPRAFSLLLEPLAMLVVVRRLRYPVQTP